MSNVVIINETFKSIFGAEVRLKIDLSWKVSGTLIPSSLTNNTLTRAEDNSSVQSPRMRRVLSHWRMRSRHTGGAFKGMRQTQMITPFEFPVFEELRTLPCSGSCAGMPVFWKTNNNVKCCQITIYHLISHSNLLDLDSQSDLSHLYDCFYVTNSVSMSRWDCNVVFMYCPTDNYIFKNRNAVDRWWWWW